MKSFVSVAAVADVPAGSAIRVEVAGRAIAIYNLGGEFFATDDTCTHARASLSEGQISGDEVMCPLHFACFNIKTGECTCGPAYEDLRIYEVRIDSGQIQVAVPPE